MKKSHGPISDLGAGIVKLALGTAFIASVAGGVYASNAKSAQEKEVAIANQSFAAIDVNPNTKDIELAPQ